MLLHIALLLTPWSKRDQRKAPPFIVERITPDKIKKQIVDDTKMANKLIPDATRFMSKQDNAVEEETKAARTAKTKNSQPSVLMKPDTRMESQKPSPSKSLKMADLGLKPYQQRNPSQRKPSMTSPPSATDDYLPDIKSGFQTALNTREFKFYSYFERIKDRLRMYWEPQLQKRVNQLYAKGQTLPDADLTTQLQIVLTKRGELSKISIIRNSGLEEIDLAALKAFELAAPFPNPPSGMIESNGHVNLIWSFVVQTRGLSDIFVFLSKF